jgi:hypothetical protein
MPLRHHQLAAAKPKRLIEAGRYVRSSAHRILIKLGKLRIVQTAYEQRGLASTYLVNRNSGSREARDLFAFA